MIKIFTGDDRVRAKASITKFLGADYEIIDGGDLSPQDLPTVFLGLSLFAAKRRIMIRDFLANRSVASEIENYLNTPHDIALFETKIDKRSVTYKSLQGKIAIEEYKLPEINRGAVFEIYRTAKKDGSRAVKLLEPLKTSEDPVMFTGLLISQALKDFSAHPGAGERRALQSLAKADLAMKTTGMDPWLVVESFLVQLSSIIRG